MKRFYRDVAVVTAEGGRTITLDARPVRTPARAPLILPTAALADAVAAEWSAQGDAVLPLTMPLTGLSNAAIDRIAPDRARFAASLAAFAAHDLLVYRAEGPAPLVARQAAVWDPLLAWAGARYDVAFTRTTGIAHVAQPPATLVRLGAAYAAFDAFRLAALNQIVTVAGSAVVGLAAAAGRLDADGVWAVGQLDELWQAEQWGRDPLAEAGHNDKRTALDAALRLLALLD